MAPKDKDTIQQKVGSYTGLDLVGWTVMKSTLGNHLGLLANGKRNI